MSPTAGSFSLLRPVRCFVCSYIANNKNQTMFFLFSLLEQTQLRNKQRGKKLHSLSLTYCMKCFHFANVETDEMFICDPDRIRTNDLPDTASSDTTELRRDSWWAGCWGQFTEISFQRQRRFSLEYPELFGSVLVCITTLCDWFKIFLVNFTFFLHSE